MTEEKKKSSKGLKRVAKIVAWCVGVIVALMALAMGLVVWILTPERLTKMVHDAASEYIDGEVTLGKVELTVWSTFPHARVDIDKLTIRTEALDSLRGRFKEYTDTVMAVEHVHAGINLAELATGKIHLSDAEICGLMVNALAADSAHTNYDILRLPPDTTEVADDEPLDLPDIEITRFAMVGSRAIRYVSVTDSIDARLVIAETQLTDAGIPTYKIDTGMTGTLMAAPDIAIDDFTIQTDGRIAWQSSKPYAIAMDGFTVTLNGVAMKLGAAMDFAEEMCIERMAAELPSTPITTIIDAIPQSLLPDMEEIRSSLAVAIRATSTEPYYPGRDAMPSVDVEIDMPAGDIHYGKDITIDKIGLNLAAHLNGADIDRSTVELKRLYFQRLGTAFSLNGTATRLLSDPKMAGHFEGSVDFDRLPPRLVGYIPGEISGRMEADADFNLRMSDLDANRFHRAKLTGEATFKDLRYSITDSVETRMYTRNATVRLGTSDAFTTRRQERIDSLLTASVKLDTLSLYYDQMDFELSNLKAGIGCLNTADSRDTTQVNPIGGSFSFDRFRFTGPDSTRIRLRNIAARATLRRYQGDKKLPEVLAKVAAKRIRYIDRLNRVSLSEGEFNLRANIKPKADSATIAARRKMASRKRQVRAETLTMDLDQPTRRFIRRLNLRGSLVAKRGRLFTPYFPLRNRIKDVNMTFTTDSVTFNDILYRAGDSDFRLSGSISNISRFLTSKRGAQLRIEFASKSGKIDVNQLSAAVFAGAAFADSQAEQSYDLSAIEDEEKLDAAVASTVSDTITAIVVPFNIDAEVALQADTVIYTDIALRQFNGELLMRNGAINLSDLSARTDFGSANLTALYSAPKKDDIRFGFGMKLDKVDLKEAIGLIPQVDSLMPLIKNFAGIVSADVAATTDVDSAMNFVMPTLNAAIKLEGDSLVLLDPDTFKSVSKWLLFKKKNRNIIDHMGVELLVQNSTLELFPFMFDIDRYRIGVMGYNDMALNLNYHVSVLKSPLPFKFGINISGNADDMKIRLGKAKYNEKSAGRSVAIVDTTRVNLLKQIENVFRRGANSARLEGLNVGYRRQDMSATAGDTISRADSLEFIRAGLLPPPDTTAIVATEPSNNETKLKR